MSSSKILDLFKGEPIKMERPMKNKDNPRYVQKLFAHIYLYHQSSSQDKTARNDGNNVLAFSCFMFFFTRCSSISSSTLCSVFFDINIGDESSGRIVMELFKDDGKLLQHDTCCSLLFMWSLPFSRFTIIESTLTFFFYSNECLSSACLFVILNLQSPRLLKTFVHYVLVRRVFVLKASLFITKVSLSIVSSRNS